MSLLPEKRVYGSRQIVAQSLFELDHMLQDYAARCPNERLVSVAFIERRSEAMHWIATWEKLI